MRMNVVLTRVWFPIAAEAAAKEAEFLVKWTGKSHAHNEWVPESMLAKLAKRKLANFKRRHGGCSPAAWQRMPGALPRWASCARGLNAVFLPKPAFLQ